MTKITEYRISELRKSIQALRFYFNEFLNKPTKDANSPNNIQNKKIFKASNFKNNFIKNNKNEVKINQNEEKKVINNDNKIKVLAGDSIVKQGEKGDSAFLILSGSFNVEIDNKVVGSMIPGEIFGELSLILGEDRKATVKAVTGSEVVLIDHSFLEEYFLVSKTNTLKISQSKLEIQKIIKDFAVELGKKKDFKISTSKEKIEEVTKFENHTIKSLINQLHKRLSRMVSDEKKNLKN